MKSGAPPRRSFAAFRQHITVLAGHYQQVFRADCSFTLEPLSLAFDEMDQIDLDDLFVRVIDVALEQMPLSSNGKVNRHALRQLLDVASS